jgi:NADPH-dependent 2,4-dienoyl-CoA reductase/sulfur reductase-like enzyme
MTRGSRGAGEGILLSIGRRAFLGLSAAVPVALAAPALAGRARARLVVIGGGAAGASIARRLVHDRAAVTLIEPRPVYTTCFASNLYLAGLRSLDSLRFGYDGIRALGVEQVAQRATGIDRDRARVALQDGGTVAYDRLVVAPGIDFVPGSVPGWSPEAASRMPHAFGGGDQLVLLRRQIEAMRPGGVFAMIAPPDPSRCPPAPYERVSMVAHLLTRINPTARILIVDPKDGFADQALFEEGWQAHYSGMIERLGPEMNAGNIAVDPDRMQVLVDDVPEPVDVCNVIPAQQAGAIARLAGLAGQGGWAATDPLSLQSRADPRIWVLGDSADTAPMAKSAFSAHGQARVAAAAILAELGLARPDDRPPVYHNACWSVLAPGDAVRAADDYRPSARGITRIGGSISQMGEDAATRRARWDEAQGWYRAITSEIFG